MNEEIGTGATRTSSWLDGLLLKLPAGPARRITPFVQRLLDGLRSLGSGRQIGILLADTVLLDGGLRRGRRAGSQAMPATGGGARRFCRTWRNSSA